MGSGCGDPIVERVPSSSGQLPVPVALNAGSPTLFSFTIHDTSTNVNTQNFQHRIFRDWSENRRGVSREGPPDSWSFPGPNPYNDSTRFIRSLNKKRKWNISDFYSARLL